MMQRILSCLLLGANPKSAQNNLSRSLESVNCDQRACVIAMSGTEALS